MTFTLKDFRALKQHFNDTKTIILKHYKKDSIDALHETRKEELLFLQAVLTELETRIPKPARKDENLKPFAEVFAGAMLVIQQDIKSKLGYVEREANSLLLGRLQDALKSKEGAPDLYQLASYHKHLNNFLAVIFKEGNSKKGLKPDNIFKAIPLDRVASIVNISYSMEDAVHKEITKNYGSGGKPDAKVSTYALPDHSAPYLFKFDELKKELDKLILTQLADKKVASIALLPNKDRSTQLHMLKILADMLASADASYRIQDKERAAILAGIMLLVREQIAVEYKKTPLNTDEIEKSVIHKGLSTILNTAEMSRQDAQSLIKAAKSFIAHMTLEHTVAKDGVKECVRSKHIFSDVPGFKLVAVMDFMQSLITFCRMDALRSCVMKHMEAIAASKPKEAGFSLAGMMKGNWSAHLWGGKPKVVGDAGPDVEEEEDEEADAQRDKDDQKSYSPKASASAAAAGPKG